MSGINLEISPKEKLEAALAYARRDWPVFPIYARGPNGQCSCSFANCSSPAKHPRVKHGVREATTNEVRIRFWWKQWPSSNIALATGKASNTVVVDIDPRHDGEASLRILEEQRGKIPPTLECLTGGGGRHLYFFHPGISVKNKVGLAPGIDIRGDGGYVLLPPSNHISGGTYQWKIPR